LTRPARPLPLALVLLALACTSQPTDDGQREPDGSAGDNAGGSGGNVTPQACPEGPHPGTDAAKVVVGVVTGNIVDEQGEPTSSGLVQVCAKNVCLDAKVGDDGKLVKQVNQDMTSPACKIGDGKLWGKLAFPIGGGDTELGTLMTVRLPDFADGVTLAPGETASSGGVSLSIASDAGVEIDTLSYVDASQSGFRAAELPEAARTALDPDFVAAFALAPLETRICPSPALSIENTAGLEPGTALELYISGLDVGEYWAPYAGWEKVSEGEVSADGARLEFPEGPPLLTALGIKVKE
jgi:hypothetical protein